MEKKEAMKILKNFYDKSAQSSIRTALDTVIPEITVSEDERMKNAAIRACKYMVDNFENSTKDYEDAIVWLKKQGEQKSNDIRSIEERANQVFPDDGDENTPLYRQSFIDGAVDYIDCGCTKSVWNEEDMIKLKSTITLLNNPNLIENNKELRDKTIDWLKSLKGRVQPQPKQEWSKEDEVALDDALWCCKQAASIAKDENDMGNVWYAERWLKSLRPQNWTKEDKERYISCLQRLSTGNPEQPETINSKWFKEHVYPQPTWKPGYEQMAILCDVIGKLEHDNYKYIYVIHELFNDLKKLREE